MIFSIHIYQVNKMCRMQEWLLPLPTLLSYLPYMNFIGESLCTQLLLYPYRHFNDIWYTYISGEDVSHARMVAPLSCSSDNH